MSFVVKKMMKKLDILDETNSEIIFKCPVCNGKLKASKNYVGKYLCVTGECSSRKIRKKLGFNNESEERNRGKPYPEMTILEYSSSDSIIGVELKEYLNKVKVTDDNENNITYYGLDDNNYVFRDNKKKIFKTYYESDFPPLFNEHFLRNKYGTVVFLEGEKSANIFTLCTGLLGLSIPAGKNKTEYVEYKLKELKPNISSILIFPDNDKAGFNKARGIKKLASKTNIKSKILSPYRNKYGFKKGDDIEEFCQVHDPKYFVLKNL